MATRLVQRTYHRSNPYRAGNSPAGIEHAAAAGYAAIDLDAHISHDSRWENIHWAIPGREGFRYTSGPKKGSLVGRRVSAMPHSTIASLRTRGGDHIQTFGTALELAAKAKRPAGMKRLKVEVEPKGVPSVADFGHLAFAAKQAYGEDWARYVLVKRLTLIPGWRSCLKNAKAAGFTTVALRVRYPRSLPSYVDHYRR